MKLSAARLRTAAAALIAAAAVASCGSGRATPTVAAETPSTPASASGDVNPSTTAPAPTPDVATETSTIATPTSAATTPTPATATPTSAATNQTPAATDTSTAGTVTTLIAAESSSATAAPAPTGSGTDTVASWGYSLLADHLRQDAEDTRIQAPNPAVIRIPRIDVEAPIIPLGLRDDGSIEVPEGTEETGWWLGGPEPGETGPAVILGHVDSEEEGPAVFFYLRYLEAGDEIHIDRVDGSTVTYVVDSIESHDKDEFPTDAVYGPTEDPTLRLVTCGGDFDFDVRTYKENLVVFASLA